MLFLYSFSTLTWLKPKWTEAVSEIYIILPSGATTNMKPSKVCKRCEPNSLILAPLCMAGEVPQASPKPKKEKFNNLWIYAIVLVENILKQLDVIIIFFKQLKSSSQ